MKFPPLVLASRSPRRRVLLNQIGLRFSVRPSRVDETFDPKQSPSANAKRIALEKALDVASRTKVGIIIGADTIVVLGNRILGKPKSARDAQLMLRTLSGREHLVYTGFALVDSATAKKVVGIEKTRVKFRTLNHREIAEYVDSGSPMDKAGAYGIQDDYGAVFVEKVIGCFYNVMGFPLTKFYVTLRNFLSQTT